MKRYIYNIIALMVALVIATTAMGQTNRGTLPDPNELNEDLSTGIYKLTKNYKPGSQRRWRVSSGRNVIVDLNGYTIDGVNIDRTIFNISNGTLTIRDSKGGGTIKNSTKSCFYVAPSSGDKSTLNLEGGTILNCQPSDGNGGAMDIQPNGTVNMSGGIITGCKGTSGAAVYVIGGTFNMTGGEIKENKVNALKTWTPPTGGETLPETTNTNTTRGGGIYVEKGKCTVSGGTISGNVAHSGGGVFVTAGATFSFTGGTIEGNYAVSKLGQGTGNGGGIYIEGGNSNCTINGGTVRNNRATRYGGGININGSTMTIPNCTISGNLASSGGGISMETSGSTLNLQGCTLSSNIAKISGKDPNGANGGGGGIFINNGTLKMSSTNRFQENRSYALGGGVFMKSGSMSVTGSSTFSGNQATNTTNTDASGGAIYLANGNITVDANGILTVGGSNSADGNIAKTNGGGIYCKGTITINGESSIKNNTANNGGGIYCVQSITLNNTTIANNSAVVKGGGLYCAAAVTVNGTSTIKNNTAEDGGAAYVSENNLSLAQCTVTGNTSSHYGGAFYVDKGNITFKNTATISENKAKERGGAAYVNAGQVNTASGYKTTLSNNTVEGNGNGTYSGGAFYIEGASDTNRNGHLNLNGETLMSGNSCPSNGGAIAVRYGGITLKGSSVTLNGNKANNGGAFYVSSGTVTVDGTSTSLSIKDNISQNHGGAIYVKNGSFITNSSILLDGNKAQKGSGGAVYVSNGDITTGEGIMTNNKADNGLGGVFFVSGGNINLNGYTEMKMNAAKDGGALAIEGGLFNVVDDTSIISNNSASENGGGLWVSASDKTIAFDGGSFIGNTALGNGGGIYVDGSLALDFKANLKQNVAQNGGGIYITNGAKMNFVGGLIVLNKAVESDNSAKASNFSGVGGGIYLDTNATLDFTDKTELGIYNNIAEYEAADIYTSGNGTTLYLPYVKYMNLRGLDVAGSELNWMEDYAMGRGTHPKYGRYEDVLLRTFTEGIAISNLIVDFTDGEIANNYKEVKGEMSLDLGYDLVFVKIISKGLAENDFATLEILYPKVAYDEDGNEISETPTRFIELSFVGEQTKIVGLPSGNWKFKCSRLSFNYENLTENNFTNDGTSELFSDKTDIDEGLREGYALIKSKRNDEITVKYVINQVKDQTLKDNAVIINKMNPKVSNTSKTL